MYIKLLMGNLGNFYDFFFFLWKVKIRRDSRLGNTPEENSEKSWKHINLISEVYTKHSINF